MIDINTLISNALIAAVQQATTPLVERIATLETICATQHEAMVAMRDRIAALENQAIVTSNAVDTRITALETKLTEAALFTQTSNVTIPIDEAKMVEALNSQEWFWEKLQNRIDAGIEQAVDNHCETYDHDSYDSAVSTVEDYNFDGFVTSDRLDDAVREAVGNLSFDIRVS